jgi:hypothetical protein
MEWNYKMRQILDWWEIVNCSLHVFFAAVAITGISAPSALEASDQALQKVPSATFDLYLQAYLQHFLFCIVLSLWSLVTYSVRKLWNCVKSVATATQTCHYMDHLQITTFVYISQVIFTPLLLNLIFSLLITDRPNASSFVITTPLNF